MKMFHCDRCGATSETAKGYGEEVFAQDWEVVRISGLDPIDICKNCALLLFHFLSTKPGTANGSDGAQAETRDAKDFGAQEHPAGGAKKLPSEMELLWMQPAWLCRECQSQ